MSNVTIPNHKFCQIAKFNLDAMTALSQLPDSVRKTKRFKSLNAELYLVHYNLKECNVSLYNEVLEAHRALERNSESTDNWERMAKLTEEVQS